MTVEICGEKLNVGLENERGVAMNHQKKTKYSSQT